MERFDPPESVAQDNRGLTTPAKAPRRSPGYRSALGPVTTAPGITTPVVLVRRGPKPRRNPTNWLVGILAMTGAIFQAGDALFIGDGVRAAWWLAGALVLQYLARHVEAFRRGGVA